MVFAESLSMCLIVMASYTFTGSWYFFSLKDTLHLASVSSSWVFPERRKKQNKTEKYLQVVIGVLFLTIFFNHLCFFTFVL